MWGIMRSSSWTGRRDARRRSSCISRSNAPHDPRQSPKEYVDKYPLEKISLPKSFLPEYPFKDVMGCPKGLRDEALAPFPRTEYAVKVNRQEYYAIITHMDAQLGRILDALEASGKAKDTVIFFNRRSRPGRLAVTG